LAERLADDGFTVVINYSGDAAPAEALARKIEDKGGRAVTAKADVSNAQAVRGMFDAAEAAFGGVDVLVIGRDLPSLGVPRQRNSIAADSLTAKAARCAAPLGRNSLLCGSSRRTSAVVGCRI
jgi:3-oxoacyl-[acyl-carrier protein] reductase